PDHLAGRADVAIPSERGRLLDRDARLHLRWEHPVAILPRLFLEDLPRRHGNDAGSDSVSDERLVSLRRKAHLTARRDQDTRGMSPRPAREHAGAARAAGRRLVIAPIQRRQRLPRKREHRWLMAELQHVTIRLHHFLRVPGPQGHEPWDGTQRCQVLDRLVRSEEHTSELQSLTKTVCRLLHAIKTRIVDLVY